MAVRPLSPQEAQEVKILKIPDTVLKAVNRLLVRNLTSGGYAQIRQKDLEAEILLIADEDNAPISIEEILRNNWLDFEPLYRAEGWSVLYDRPAYNESYPASWTFSRK